jgi:hypothetical protein
LSPENWACRRTTALLLGVALPLLCLTFDPFVFRSMFGSSPLLGRVWLLAHLIMGSAMLALFFWISVRRAPGLSAGVMALGAVFSFCLGVALLPFSMFGLVAVVGILGLLPFLTTLVYWRNASAAFAAARLETSYTAAVATVSALAVASLAVLAQVHVHRAVTRDFEAALLSDSERSDAISRLRLYRHIADVDWVALDYLRRPDPALRIRLAEVYRDVTGRDVSKLDD